MGQGSGIREVAWLDIAGGGQVVLDGNTAYVGHMDPPHGTSVVDVADPANPRIVASIDIPPGLHSHKVRVANDIMVTNRERTRGTQPAPPGTVAFVSVMPASAGKPPFAASARVTLINAIACAKSCCGPGRKYASAASSRISAAVMTG